MAREASRAAAGNGRRTRKASQKPGGGHDHLLDLLEHATTAVHDERRPGDALRAALRLVAEYNHWRAGHVYRLQRDPPIVVSTTLSYSDGAVAEPRFERTVRAMQETAGIELATRVLRTCRPLWIGDFRSRPALRPLVRHGVHAIAQFPVMTPAQPVAVLEFLAGDAVRPPPDFMRLMRALGIQLGYLIERARLQRHIAGLAEREQQRIAMDLHDSVGQEAAAIGMLARMLHQDLQRRSAAEADLARRLQRSVQQMKQRIHDFVTDLRPIDADVQNLKAELQQMAARQAELSGCACLVDVEKGVAITDPFARTQVARIAREAVHNAVKHGAPQHVWVTLRRGREETIELTILDDGKGADPASLNSGGLGHQIMEYRADLLSADLEIGPAPAGGFRVRCIIPREALETDETKDATT
jgi:signal transduction histidine kinase